MFFNYLKKIQISNKRAPIFEIYKNEYNCEQEDIFINFKKIKNILKNFTTEDMKLDFLQDDLEFCLSNNEDTIFEIKIFLVSIIMFFNKKNNSILSICVLIKGRKIRTRKKT